MWFMHGREKEASERTAVSCFPLANLVDRRERVALRATVPAKAISCSRWNDPSERWNQRLVPREGPAGRGRGGSQDTWPACG